MSEPQRRPGHRPWARLSEEDRRWRNGFFLDLEAYALEEWYGPCPQGRRRHLDPLWVYHMQQYLWPHVDADFYEYAEWVQQGGGEDEFLSSTSSCGQSGWSTDTASGES